MVPRVTPSFPALHDHSRHLIHLTELLGVALSTVDSMTKQHGLFLRMQKKQPAQNLPVALQTQQYMQFQHRMLLSIRARSEAVNFRLQNEINLVTETSAPLHLS